AQAAGEYRRALNASERQGDRPLPDPRPLLNNNLGAIMQDGGDPAATAAFAQAVEQLAGRDLGALRYNLGLSYLHDGKFGNSAARARRLGTAANLPPPPPPLLVSLSAAYRMDGRFDQPQDPIEVARQQTAAEAQPTTAELRALLGARLRAGVAEQSALLN